LLERLSRKRPEENQSVSRSEPAFTEFEQRRGNRRVEAVLEDDRPDPRSDEHKDDAGESDLGAGLDVDLLTVKEVADDEGREDTGKVGEEGGERARLDSLGLVLAGVLGYESEMGL